MSSDHLEETKRNVQLFKPYANIIAKASIVLGGLAALGGLLLIDQIIRSPYSTDVAYIRDQPVEFSHKHHVQGVGLDCRYCHTSVEKSAFAGIPPTSTCLNCHSQIWADQPMIKPLHESAETGKPIEWKRIHDLPDFVYFNHSIHIDRGVACTTCHGEVDKMPLMWKANTLYMGWCLDCHKKPENFIGKREDVYKSGIRKPTKEAGAQLVQDYHVQQNINCTACHR